VTGKDARGTESGSISPTRRRSRATKTSVSDPIRVDFLPLNLRGRIGLTFAPGKKALSLTGIRWERDLHTDLDRLVEVYRTDLLVCLVEDHELARLGIPDLVEQAVARGIEVLRLPIRDGGVLPNPQDVADVVGRILGAVQMGSTVVLHCAGGLGRTGTVAGCALVALEYEPEDALQILHEVRGPRCPENARQELFIEKFAEVALRESDGSSRGHA